MFASWTSSLWAHLCSPSAALGSLQSLEQPHLFVALDSISLF